MPFTTFRGEGSVEEIADRHFTGLTPKQREVATKAILKANPQLGRLADVKPGVLIEVPDIPALRAKEAAAEATPDREFLTGLHAATKDYVAQLLERQARDTARVKGELAALAEPQFRKAIGRSQPLVALADSAARELELRAKTADERRKGLETALGRALQDIEARSKRA